MLRNSNYDIVVIATGHTCPPGCCCP